MPRAPDRPKTACFPWPFRVSLDFKRDATRVTGTAAAGVKRTWKPRRIPSLNPRIMSTERTDESELSRWRQRPLSILERYNGTITLLVAGIIFAFDRLSPVYIVWGPVY